MPNNLLESKAIREALTREGQNLPKGYDTLSTLKRETLLTYVDHPDRMLVQIGRYRVSLPEVNSGGYRVYDSLWTLRSSVVINEEDPNYDPSQEGERTMLFGAPFSDQLVCEAMRHGDFLYITYERNNALPRCILVLFVDPEEG